MDSVVPVPGKRKGKLCTVKQFGTGLTTYGSDKHCHTAHVSEKLCPSYFYGKFFIATQEKYLKLLIDDQHIVRRTCHSLWYSFDISIAVDPQL